MPNYEFENQLYSIQYKDQISEKVLKTPMPTAIAKILRFHELFLSLNLAFVESKKYERKSSTLKQQGIDNSKF